MSARNPLLLPESQDLLLDPAGKHHPPIQRNSLSLVAWAISRNVYKQDEYQKGCNPYYKLPKNQVPKHYELAWDIWVNRQSGRKICSTGCDINDILDYLATFFDCGFQYNTTESHRSAISAFYNPTGGIKFGDHRRVFALLTGIFNQ